MQQHLTFEELGRSVLIVAPFVDLASGRYDFTLTLPGSAAVTDKIEIAADETWALVAGPGGALPLELY